MIPLPKYERSARGSPTKDKTTLEAMLVEADPKPSGPPSPTRQAKAVSQGNFKNLLDQDKFVPKIEATRRPIERTMDLYSTGLVIGDTRSKSQVKLAQRDAQQNYAKDIEASQKLQTTQSRQVVSRRPTTPVEDSLLMAAVDAKEREALLRKQKQIKQVQDIIQKDLHEREEMKKDVKVQYSGFIIGASDMDLAQKQIEQKSRYKQLLDHDLNRDAGNNTHKLDNANRAVYATRKTNVSLTEPEVNNSGLTGILIGNNEQTSEDLALKRTQYKTLLDGDYQRK